MNNKNLSLPAKVSVALLLLVALYLRLHVVLNTDVIAPMQADAADYYSYAYNMRHSGVYSLTKPTGYACLLYTSPSPRD